MDWMSWKTWTAVGGLIIAVFAIYLFAAPQATPVLQPVTATVGGVPATVAYAGSAAGLVSGVMQVNLIIPATAPTGSSVPIVVSVGTANSQAGVTVAVQ